MPPMFRFRSTLLVLLGGLVLLTAVTIGVAAYLNARASGHELSGQVLEQTSRRIEQQIDKLIEQAIDQCELTRGLIDGGVLDPDDPAKLVEYWRRTFAVEPQTTSFFLGVERTGAAIGVSRLLHGKLTVWQTERRPDSDKLALREYSIDDFPKKPFLSDTTDLDIRKRPWYVSARQAGKGIWTDTYFFLGIETTRDVLGVTYALPYFDKDKSLKGVLTADFDLETISRFLGSLRIGERGSAFLVEKDAEGVLQIIAHPRSDLLMRAPKTTPEARHVLTPLDEFKDERARAMIENLLADGSLRFFGNGEFWIGSVRPLEAKGGAARPRWLICTFLPESEVLAYADEANRLTMLIGLGVLGLAILLSIYLSRQVARPLERLASEALAVGRLEIDSRPAVRSIVLEVDQLGTATEEMKTGLRSFQKYLPVELVRGLLASGQEAKLGGEKREVTIAFSDIAGFTSIAETMPSDALVEHLGDYLAALSHEIMESGGTVDKFIGDSIMAFWGAPAVNAAHAVAACIAADRCRKKLAELRPRWLAAGKPALKTRIGLGTGEVIVGNIGSAARMNYTVIGDAANLASRLEGLNKHYGTEILLGERTYLEAKDRIVARPIDLVTVAGRAEAATVYELIGLVGEVDPAIEELAGRYAEALRTFQTRRWTEAQALLEEQARRWPDDGPTRVLLARCRLCLETPPGAEWDAVNRMAHK
jgi:adenylate cyclase